MKFIATCLLFLLVSDYESKVVKDFARYKCDCFEELAKTGDAMKRQNDKQTGGAVFGGTTVSMNLDSCAYSLLNKRQRTFVNNLDSMQLSAFYSSVNSTIAQSCKAAAAYNAKKQKALGQ